MVWISLPKIPKYASEAVPLNVTIEPLAELGVWVWPFDGVLITTSGASKFNLNFLIVIGEYSSPSYERTLNETSPSPSEYDDISQLKVQVLKG